MVIAYIATGIGVLFLFFGLIYLCIPKKAETTNLKEAARVHLTGQIWIFTRDPEEEADVVRISHDVLDKISKEEEATGTYGKYLVEKAEESKWTHLPNYYSISKKGERL